MFSEVSDPRIVLMTVLNADCRLYSNVLVLWAQCFRGPEALRQKQLGAKLLSSLSAVFVRFSVARYQ
jgi:hypothetical protein